MKRGEKERGVEKGRKRRREMENEEKRGRQTKSKEMLASVHSHITLSSPLLSSSFHGDQCKNSGR
jgi:hypothetical protein